MMGNSPIFINNLINLVYQRITKLQNFETTFTTQGGWLHPPLFGEGYPQTLNPNPF